MELERCASGLVRHCGIQRRTLAKTAFPLEVTELHWELFFFTLRRSRGAMGRYQGTSGAVWAASVRVRRPRRKGAAMRNPRGGKGVKSYSTSDPSSWILLPSHSIQIGLREEALLLRVQQVFRVDGSRVGHVYLDTCSICTLACHLAIAVKVSIPELKVGQRCG